MSLCMPHTDTSSPVAHLCVLPIGDARRDLPVLLVLHRDLPGG